MSYMGRLATGEAGRRVTYGEAYDSLSHGDGSLYRRYCAEQGIEATDHAAELLDNLLACRREAEGLDHVEAA